MEECSDFLIFFLNEQAEFRHPDGSCNYGCSLSINLAPWSQVPLTLSQPTACTGILQFALVWGQPGIAGEPSCSRQPLRCVWGWEEPSPERHRAIYMSLPEQGCFLLDFEFVCFTGAGLCMLWSDSISLEGSLILKSLLYLETLGRCRSIYIWAT